MSMLIITEHFSHHDKFISLLPRAPGPGTVPVLSVSYVPQALCELFGAWDRGKAAAAGDGHPRTDDTALD